MTTITYTQISIFIVLLTSPLIVTAQSPTEDTRRPYDYAQVTPSMAIIIAVLIVAIFFMGFFSIYIRHCSSGSSVHNGLTNTARPRQAAAARGLEASVIESFPTLVYSEVKGLHIGKGALECAVCLCEFEDDETLRLLPKCDHVFHPDCIDEWLASHTTCPVCRTNLTPQPGDPPAGAPAPELEVHDDDVVVVELEPEQEPCQNQNAHVEPDVISVNQTLNRNRTRGSRSGRPRKFPRSHSTGHSLVQPCENTDRFTLRLPVEVRKQIMNRKLNRTTSLAVFTRDGSSRRGYKISVGDGSHKGMSKRLEPLEERAKSDRWIFSRTPSFLARASSILTRASSSVRSQRVAAVVDGEGTSTSTATVGPDPAQSSRPPV